MLPVFGVARAEEQAGPKSKDPFSGFSALAEAFEQIGDWDQQYEQIAAASGRLWEENGWNDEADLYARDAFLKVACIPPWEIGRRLEKLTEICEERYDLTPRQTQAFRRRVVYDVSKMLFRHGGLIIEQTREYVSAIGSGESISAEQVAQWTRENEPLMQDAKQVFVEFLDDFERTMTPEQRAILARDRGSADKRIRYVEEQRAQWAQGKWDPSKWGLQDDPTPRPPPEKPAAQGGRQGSLAEVTRWKDYDPGTWIAYLRHFQQQYALDPGQTTAAESIHTETAERAEAYMQGRAAELGLVPEEDRDTHPVFAPVRALFSELQDRFSALLTSEQRKGREY